MSGFYGGCWGIGSKANDDDGVPFSGHDGSGLCLTEARLDIGFIHCPVPFWGGLQYNDILNIGRSAAMKPWSVGGEYDKPFCRRVLSEAGIPDELYAQSKKGASEHTLGADGFMSPSSSADYHAWLLSNRRAWLQRGKPPPIPSVGRAIDLLLVRIVMPILTRLAIPIIRHAARITGLELLKRATKRLRRITRELVTAPMHVRRYTFAWALERAKQRYGAFAESSNDPVYRREAG